ncbi:MAG: SDR family oxidoreductase [Petrimonas sp.]|jgi:NAD(P)H dehydrogenase (quinone)|uniref:SDR family oxidoreductase n=2 Tax=Dysgonomonadaceae TaxID=2005520 RepID=UPI000E9430C8|nr:SDR family oxidoreductase [Petrimonas sp.]NLU30266.1 SDR family oxidoreductase [Bacteroidales bacterium]BBD45820.1 Male sterility domain-containing protein [Petrimonas sp. IBARAKI]HBK41688.1 NAD(P)-dependent oxidoreductase [Porphyromonadaceae bacterium]MDD3541933.1 SDR family oxidoreductase [Petrimonas sp.]
MKIAVTGATGHLGTFVVEELKKRVSNENIVALVRTPGKASALEVEVRAFDYNQPETMTAALAGVDRLVLISGNEIGQRARQHFNVIEAAGKAGVEWIVYTSLLHADSTTLNLAGEHMTTEEALKASGINYTILRNGWYTENYTGSIGGALAGGAFIGSAGNGKISSAARVDYAEAAAVAITDESHKGKVYELAGDDYYTLADLAAEISNQTGTNIPYRNLTEAEYTKILESFEIPAGFAAAIASWDVSASKDDLFDDSHQLSALIGRPTTPLADSVKAAL